jgi:hypothetical protein
MRLPGFMTGPVGQLVGRIVEKAFCGIDLFLVEGLLGLTFLCSALLGAMVFLSLPLVLWLLELPSLALASIWLLLAAGLAARISLKAGGPASWREDARTGLDVCIAALLAYLMLYCQGAPVSTCLASFFSSLPSLLEPASSTSSLLEPAFGTSSLVPLLLLLVASLATRLYLRTKRQRERNGGLEVSKDDISFQVVDILLAGLLLCWKGLSLYTGLVLGAALVLATWDWSHQDKNRIGGLARGFIVTG